jgi:predicted RNA-binding protein with EMAP domain
MENVSYAQKLIDLAEALGIVTIIDGKEYTLEDIKKITDDEKIIDLLEIHVIEMLEEEKHYPKELAQNIDEIYKTYFSKENGVLDYLYDLSIDD